MMTTTSTIQSSLHVQKPPTTTLQSNDHSHFHLTDEGPKAAGLKSYVLDYTLVCVRTGI